MDREDEIYMDARVKRPEAIGLIEKDKIELEGNV